MDVEIRHLKAAEANSLDDFFYLTLYVPEGQSAFPRDILKQPKFRKYFAHWGRQGDIGLVAIKEDSGMIGAIWSRLHITEYPGYGFVDEDTPEFSIAVKPEHRGKGVGTRLLHRYMQEARLLGYRKISLSVDTDNPAFQLYQKLGFRPLKHPGNPTMILRLSRTNMKLRSMPED